MTICSIALAIHCVGRPLVKICPAKTVLGDHDIHAPAQDDREIAKKPGQVEDKG
jgi:hypothetical protein